jgi:hypothetical protein
MTPVYNGTNQPEYAIPARYMSAIGGQRNEINIYITAPVGVDKRALGKEVHEVLAPYLSSNPSAKVAYK